jgi:K+ transporter
MHFFDCEFCMWLWKTNINYRREKWTTLYHLSRIFKNSKESRKSLIVSHSWIYAKTDLTTANRKSRFSTWRLNSCDDQFYLKLFFCQYSRDHDNRHFASIVQKNDYAFSDLNLSVHLSTVSIRSHSISEEHASKLSEWKRYDFLKLMKNERSTIRWFRIQRFNDVISTWSRFMLSSMNKHWHFFKMIVDRPSL